ncbi:MAG TPA: 3'-5' exonuclease, partial [Burkholderiales bacterium]|nr:3'-5' exonuclease [Burkholderiales bacterium]
DARLQAMTMHKAKGLEFDTVIVPGLGYQLRGDDPSLLLWLERPRAGAYSDLLLAPIREASQQEDPIYSYLKKIEGVKKEHEEARLIYVAATRAKSRLHLIGQVDGNGKNLKPKSRSLLERLWPVVQGEFEKAVQSPHDIQPEAEHAQESQAVIRRFASGWQLPAPTEGLAWKPRAEIAYEAKSPHDEVEFKWATETAKHVGTVVHRWLQAIGEEQKQGWDLNRIETLRPSFKSELESEGVPLEEINAAVERVAKALSQTLEDKRGRWLLGSKREAHCEWRLTGLIEDELVNRVIDRTFVDENGIRWIVDYKTGPHEGGDLEAFLNREQERYRKQLEQYAALMRMLDDRPLKLGLYFPLLGGWREWGV